MAIQGFSPPSPPSPSPPSPSPPSPSPYYQLLERGSARLGRVKNRFACPAKTCHSNTVKNLVLSTNC